MCASDLEAASARTGSSGALAFKDLTDRVKSGGDAGRKLILDGVSGRVEPGQLLAVMGPSGAGKSTLLDALAGRSPRPVTGSITLGGDPGWDRRRLSSYVQQEDALLGVLSVRETLTYAARLGLPRDSAVNAPTKVDEILQQLGLTHVAGQRIGTPIQRGISGGQKRRVSVGTSLVTCPKILFLDEPTSGLDSATSKEVLSSIAQAAKEQHTIVVATIHQPAWDTLSLFDGLLVLSKGRVVYNDRVDALVDWLAERDHPVAEHRNPADALIELINDDFGSPNTAGPSVLESPRPLGNSEKGPLASGRALLVAGAPDRSRAAPAREPMSEHARKIWVLMERNGLNYRRGLLSYGIRLGMYIGLGVLLATIWVSLGQDAGRINDRLSIYFFSVAFLSFMSVAGIPSFLEERAAFMRERNNGQYGNIHYVVANSLVNLPFLFACSLAFMLIMYWAIGLHSGAAAFWRFTAFLFLAIYAAESQCLLIAAFVPIFVAALALASFVNGFWMCVQGYFIRAATMPRFWYYTAHWIDYETFAFNLIAKSDLTGLKFACSGSVAGGDCFCPYTSSLVGRGECAMLGTDVLKELEIEGTSYVLYGFILVIIIFVYRALFWLGLALRRR